MIEIGVLKNFDSGIYKAGVQLMGSLTTYFDDISVARNIPSSALVIGNYVILAMPGGNPGDACVIATWPGGTPGGGMEVHGNEYHDPDFATETALAAHAAATTSAHWADADGVLTFPKQSGLRVALDTDQSIPNGTWTLVHFNYVYHDVQSEWDAVNYRVITKKPGLYLLMASSGYASSQVAADCLVGLRITVNGTPQIYKHVHTALANYFSTDCFAPMSLSANDIIQSQVYHNFGAARNLQGAPSITWLAIQKVA
jgi:hypothetical protein